MNRVLSVPTGSKSPYELPFKRTPEYTTLRNFGCLCFLHLRPYRSTKMESRSSPCVFIGYNSQHKGYKCLHIPTGRIYWSRHVIFVESEFPFANTRVLPSPDTSSYVHSSSFYSLIYPITTLISNTSEQSTPTNSTNPGLSIQPKTIPNPHQSPRLPVNPTHLDPIDSPEPNLIS